MSSALTLTGLGAPEIALTAEAKGTRDALLAEAGEHQRISDQLDADAAAELLRRMKGWTRQIEAGRSTVKSPVLELSRRIDALAAELVGQVEEQSQRISRLLGEWQAAEREKAAQALREQQRKERELRQAALSKMAAVEIESESEAQAQEQKEDIAQQCHQRIAESRQALVATLPTKITGTAVREEWRFEVTDIGALCRAHPELVVLQPNNAAIRAIIKHTQQIPGLRVWKEAPTIIRN